MELDQVRTAPDALDRADVRSWVAGGWGIALLAGCQSRDHRDLDLVVDERDLRRCWEVLERLGYAVESDWLPTRVELRGPEAARVDVHPLTFNAGGHARLTLPDGSHVDYPPEAFTTGVLDGRSTPCLAVQQQRRVHDAGYAHRVEDRHDLAELDRRRS